MIRVLIVEDSVTQREIFKRLLNADAELTVVAEASNGREAIRQVLEHRPDVVIMDIHMPDMDGITATREIMRQCPVPIVVASATLRRRDLDLAMLAYQAGAVSVIEKPEGAVLLHLHEIEPVLRSELIAASKARLRPPTGAAPPQERQGPLPPAGRETRPLVIGMCASTGGPQTLLRILAPLPAEFPIPILLVQHLSRGFEEGFARWLAGSTGQPVRLAGQGETLSPGVWLAPGGQHLTLDSSFRVRLVSPGPSDIHCPSGNPLFHSLARLSGPRGVGVLLTGMGDDGAEGLLALRRSGGQTIIQNEASCLIWGMPKTALELGAACQQLEPEDISRLLGRMTVTREP